MPGDPAKIMSAHQQHKQQHRQRNAPGQRLHGPAGVLRGVAKHGQQRAAQADQDRDEQEDDNVTHGRVVGGGRGEGASL